MVPGHEHHAAEHFLSWLSRGFAGCNFATHFAKSREGGRSVQCATILQEVTPRAAAFLEVLIDDAAANGQIAAAVFPRLRAAEDVVRLLSSLAEHPRWRCTRVDWLGADRPQDRMIGLWWKTSEGLSSSVMGFAPLGSMPVTRRAPYVAFALWAGGDANPHMKARPPEVGLANAPVEFGADQHREMMTRTRDETRRLLSDPEEEAVTLRKVAFALPVGAFVAAPGFLDTLG